MNKRNRFFFRPTDVEVVLIAELKRELRITTSTQLIRSALRELKKIINNSVYAETRRADAVFNYSN